MKNILHRSWFYWASVGVLAVLCVVLALLQNHWINEVSRAERERLHQQLQGDLNRLSHDFNNYLASSCSELLPNSADIERLGRNQAYSARLLGAKESGGAALFSRVAFAVPEDGSVSLWMADQSTGQFNATAWPQQWEGVRNELVSRINRSEFPPPRPDRAPKSNVILIPRFASSGAQRRPGPPLGRLGRPPEAEWLVVEINIDSIRKNMLPELVRSHLGADGKVDYDIVVLDDADPSAPILQTAADFGSKSQNAADASATLFNVHFGHLPEPGRPDFHGGDDGPGFGPPDDLRPPPPFRGPPHDGPGQPPGRWRILVRNHAGSLEAVVARAHWQNLATSLGILALILVTVAALVRLSRRAQRLAELQMNFVAGVSHELRTPLTVIRTAAFNLRGQLANRPEQVERYGKLIQDESEKLGALVEQVLRFASSNAGHAIRAREPVAVESLIDEGLRASGAAMASAGVNVEKRLDGDLPPVLADELALKFALQNLFDNALKYGSAGGNWLGVFASRVGTDGVEIRVADRGPGIPQEEQNHIFEPFFRGSRAIQDQVHGTGLGLNLVKRIVEAHGGEISVSSEPGQGAEFIVRLPAAPAATAPEQQHECANSLS